MRFWGLDGLVIVGYFLAVAFIGWRTGGGEHDTRGYLLGNRGIPWWAVMASIIGTEISALTFVGVPADAYVGNWTYIQLALGAILARVIVSRWFVSAYYRNNVVSIYEFLGRRFGPLDRAASVAVFLVTRVLASGVRLMAGAIIVSAAFDMDARQAIIIVAILGVGYTVLGGIKAVIWTEVLQVIVMFGGALTAAAVLLSDIPGGLTGVLKLVPTDKLTILDFRPNLTLDYTIWAALIGTTITNTAVFGTDYDMVQRMLTATDNRRSQRAVITSGLADIPISLLFLSIGTLLFAYYRIHPDPTLPADVHIPFVPEVIPAKIFPHFILHALPHGLVGLVVAALLSVVLSSFESALNSLAGSFVVDIYQPYLAKGRSGDHYVLAARVATAAFGLAMVLVAFLFQKAHNILEVGLSIGTYTYGALLALFGIGIFTRRCSDRAAAFGVPFSIAAVFLASHFLTVPDPTGVPASLSFPWNVSIGVTAGVTASFLLDAILPRRDSPHPRTSRPREANPGRLGKLPRMLKSVTEFFVRLVERWMPDPYLLCILLTFITMALALVCTPTSVDKVVSIWYDGLWDILSFATQTTLVLLTGYTLAHAPVVRQGLQQLASFADTPKTAVVGVFLITAVSSWLNWGFGLVTGAIVACEVARRVRIDFPFLVAVAYSGFVVWASGLSSTVALVTASHGNKMNVIEQLTGRPIHLSHTLFTPLNLLPTLALLVLVPLVFVRLIPSQPRAVVPPVEEEVVEAAPDTPAGRLERSRLVALLLVGLGIASIVVRVLQHTFAIDLGTIVFIFMLLGILAHGTPIRFARAFLASARLSGPLLLQYPLYGGIMGIMTNSGLADVISKMCVDLSTAHTLPFFSFVASCIISLFVPSGGGHWAVQAPIMVPAAIQLGAHQGAVAMGVAFGEQVANMVQPFWALPILAIAGLGIRDIMGYCVITLVMAFSAYGLSLLVFG